MSKSPRARAYGKLHRAGYRLRTPNTGAMRRIQALAAIGWTQKEIAARVGCAQLTINRLAQGKYLTLHLDLDKRIRQTYAELCVQPRRDSADARRAIAWARRNGWVPPLAWDNIDDPKERPKGAALTYGCAVCGERGSDGKLRRDLCKKHYQREMKEAA